MTCSRKQDSSAFRISATISGKECKKMQVQLVVEAFSNVNEGPTISGLPNLPYFDLESRDDCTSMAGDPR